MTTDTVQPGDMDSSDFAAALDDQLCVPCILCNCQGCDACVPYGAWTPGHTGCACVDAAPDPKAGS